MCRVPPAPTISTSSRWQGAKNSKSLIILKHESRLLKGTRILVHQDKMVFPSTGLLAGALLFHMSQLSSSRLTVAYPSLLPSFSNAKQEWAASTTGAGLSCQHQTKPTSQSFICKVVKMRNKIKNSSLCFDSTFLSVLEAAGETREMWSK